MKITTYNLNGIRARHDRLVAWIDRESPDVLCLQETKCTDDKFPLAELLARYKYSALAGQPSFNGVAVFSKYRIKDMELNPIENKDDTQKRMIACTIRGIRIVNLYVPWGTALGDPKFEYKLNWIGRLNQWLELDRPNHEHYVILGDFNIAPTDKDVWNTLLWGPTTVSCTEVERNIFRNILKVNRLVDSLRTLTDEQLFTWWGYRGWHLASGKQGIRIDHILHSKGLRTRSFHIDVAERGNTKGASDHTPYTIDLRKRKARKAAKPT